MPIYEYRCECGNEQETILPVQERNEPQVCSCGKIMQRKLSVPLPAIFRLTGRDMALGSLNSRTGGVSSKHDDLSDMTQVKAAAGLDRMKPVIGRGF